MSTSFAASGHACTTNFTEAACAAFHSPTCNGVLPKLSFILAAAGYPPSKIATMSAAEPRFIAQCSGLTPCVPATFILLVVKVVGMAYELFRQHLIFHGESGLLISESSPSSQNGLHATQIPYISRYARPILSPQAIRTSRLNRC